MKLTTLQERIIKATEKIVKKRNTIKKKSNLIDKKINKLITLGVDVNESLSTNRFNHRNNQEIYWLLCDVEGLKEDIERGEKEIQETTITLFKYNLQLMGEIEKENTILTKIPESLRQMQTELVTQWDAWDIKKRDRIKTDYSRLTYKEFNQKYTGLDKIFKDKTDEQIHNSNIQDSKAFILDLYNRIKDVTGEITDWTNMQLPESNMCLVLNGTVQGKEGIAKIETVLAGGYNIQRLHLRTLVHEV